MRRPKKKQGPHLILINKFGQILKSQKNTPEIQKNWEEYVKLLVYSGDKEKVAKKVIVFF